MAPEIVIEREAGAIRIGADALLLAGETIAELEPRVARLLRVRQDHGNGYAWLHLHSLGFGGAPAGLSLCFARGRLEMANWSVTLPSTSGQWSSRREIDAEIAFVRTVLAAMIGYKPRAGEMRLAWGSVWSLYDPRADIASHGLRYGQ